MSTLAPVREWFADAASAFTEVLDGLPNASIEKPALGEWTMRSLLGHTCRAFTTIEQYAGAALTASTPATTSAVPSSPTRSRWRHTASTPGSRHLSCCPHALDKQQTSPCR